MTEATTTAAAMTQPEWDTWRSFMAMRRALDVTLERELKQASEISAPDFDVLISLFGAPGKQLRPGEIGQRLGWEKSRVSHQVSRMMARALVEKQDCDGDARGTWVGITPAGSRAVLGAMRSHSTSLRQNFFDLLTDDEVAMLRAISDRVLERTNRSCEAAGDCTE